MPRPCRSKYETIGHLVLDVELEHNSSPQSYHLLDEIIDQAKQALQHFDELEPGDSSHAGQALQGIGDLLAELGFEYKENRLLGTGLQNKKIDCDSYCLVYLSIAQVLELPLKMVRAPAHAFVRWHLSERDYLNWETTTNSPKKDEYYIEKYNIVAQSTGMSALRSLDADGHQSEILATAFVSSGVEWLKKCRTKEAIMRFDEAIRRDPLYDTPYYNLGLAYYYLGLTTDAIMWCKLALKLNPNHLKSHSLLMAAYVRLKDTSSSYRHYEKVLKLDPKYYSTRKLANRKRRGGKVCLAL